MTIGYDMEVIVLHLHTQRVVNYANQSSPNERVYDMIEKQFKRVVRIEDIEKRFEVLIHIDNEFVYGVGLKRLEYSISKKCFFITVIANGNREEFDFQNMQEAINMYNEL